MAKDTSGMTDEEYYSSSAADDGKSWWEKGLDAIKGVVPAATKAYDSYTAGYLNKKIADKVSQPAQVVNWPLVAGVVAGVTVVGGVVWYLVTRRN